MIFSSAYSRIIRMNRIFPQPHGKKTSLLSHKQLGCFILIGDIKTSPKGHLLSCLGTAKNGQRWENIEKYQQKTYYLV